MTPRRIQMTRKPGGWRKDHPDAVIVARPTKWGNPFVVGQYGDADRCVRLYREVLSGLIDNTRPPMPPISELLDLQDAWRNHGHTLRGRDLACWCPLDQPCHADVLLEIANGGRS